MPRQEDIFASTKSSSVTNCKTDKSNSHRINTNVFIGNYSSFQTRGMIDDSSFVIIVSLWYFEMRTKDKSNIFLDKKKIPCKISFLAAINQSISLKFRDERLKFSVKPSNFSPK